MTKFITVGYFLEIVIAIINDNNHNLITTLNDVLNRFISFFAMHCFAKDFLANFVGFGDRENIDV